MLTQRCQRSMPLEVLVYKGPGVSETSLRHTVATLRALLTPNYTVREVEPDLLENEPWASSCALLVIPGGRDLPYVQHLAPAIQKIKDFVEQGGSFLGICAGAYFASARVEWEVGTPLEVVGDRALKFFPGISCGCAYPGFEYESETGAQLLDITASIHGEDPKQVFEGIFYNGGGVFEGADTPKMRALGVRVTAQYPNGKPAAVNCAVGKGTAALWGLHPDYPVTEEPYRSVLKRSSEAPKTSSSIETRELRRLELMGGVLAGLGLVVPGGNPSTEPPHTPLPQLLCASPHRPGAVESILSVFAQHFKPSDVDGAKEFEGYNDKFRLFGSESDRLAAARKEAEVRKESETDKWPKPPTIRDIIAYETSLPSADDARLFDIPSYFKALHEARGVKPFITQTNWGVGEVLMYGEVVTSTQSLFDRNASLLAILPHPVLSIATTQTAGRGRRHNEWLSSPGTLHQSIFMRASRRDIPENRLNFIPYVVGLAVTEACRKVMPGPEGERVRLKWPNDIYIIEADGKRRNKIGGILTTCYAVDDTILFIIGCGVNVLSQPPFASLKQLYSDGSENPSLTMENVAANIMATFEDMWRRFTESKGSFEPFMDLYLDRWLHSDEQVTLMTTDPPTKVRICGINPDTGFLQTLPEQCGGVNFIDLQPDGNSFDMMAGLIKTKA